MVERPTIKYTKAQMIDAFDQLLEENKKLAAKVNQFSTSQKETPMKVEEIAAVKPATSARQKTTESGPALDNKIGQIIANLSNQDSRFGEAISELSAKLVQEVLQLAGVQQKFDQEKSQLESLYDLNISETTLEELIQAYLQESSVFDVEFHQKQKEHEFKIDTQKKEWQKEKEAHAASIKERDEVVKLTAQREAEEYHYQLELNRKIEAAAYEQKKKNLLQELEKLEQNTKKEWAERERQLSEVENELTYFSEKVEKFPKELDAAIQKARNEGIAIAKRQVKIRADLKAKEIEGINRVNEIQLKSLEQTVTRQSEQIQDLTKQLDAVLKQAQNLAMKAIEGASNVSSLQAMKEIALEQAKNVQKNK